MEDFIINLKELEKQRKEMVLRQIVARDIKDINVLDAMSKVPRHRFVPKKLAYRAYYDGALPIGYKQTISQPYIVALMSELLQVEKGDKVLEIGTGSGYQAAVLWEMGCDVYTIEIVEPLAIRAKELFNQLGYDGIKCRTGDGYQGWVEHSPYDGIIVTAAPHTVPKPLISQLAENGRMVLPVENDHQELELVTKINGEIRTENITPVAFVPMTGEAESI